MATDEKTTADEAAAAAAEGAAGEDELLRSTSEAADEKTTADEAAELATLGALPIRELRARLAARGISTLGLLYKADLVQALNGAPAETEGGGGAVAASAAAVPDEEDELLRQALLMSTETADALGALPIRELRARLAARGISTLGLAEKADLVRALDGAPAETEGGGGAVAASAAAPEEARHGDDVQVLLTFRQRVHLLAAAAAGRPALDGCGKVAVPQSWLGALALVLGGG